MKEQGSHEGCIEQMYRLFADRLWKEQVPVDAEGRIRMDDREMDPKVQEAVEQLWGQITSENVKELTDLDSYWDDFYHMFGFHYENVDITQDVEVQVTIPDWWRYKEEDDGSNPPQAGNPAVQDSFIRIKYEKSRQDQELISWF